MFCSQLIHIYHDLLGMRKISFFPAINRVFPAFLEAGIIHVSVMLIRNRFICLFYPSYYLFVEFSLQRFGMLHNLFTVGIFSLKILNNRGILPVGQPIVIIRS